MRFEIKAAGTFLILAGLAGLSAIVFTLGLIAGYEMARQDSANQEVAAVYQLPASPPAAEPSPAPIAAVSPAVTGDQVPPTVASGGSPAMVPLAMPTAQKVASAPSVSATAPLGLRRPKAASAPAVLAASHANRLASHNAVAPEAPPAIRPAHATSRGASPLAADVPSTPAAEPRIDDASDVASTEIAATAPAKRGRFSVQIEAAMDRRGADEMVRKLRPLGYLPYIVETEMNGRAWYRVRVGPYATEADARAAEQRLHDQYSGDSAAH